MPNGFLDNVIVLVHALIGAVGAIALLVFAWGLGTYWARLGTERREHGIHNMQFGIGLLFTSIILIWILRFLESFRL